MGSYHEMSITRNAMDRILSLIDEIFLKQLKVIQPNAFILEPGVHPL